MNTDFNIILNIVDLKNISDALCFHIEEKIGWVRNDLYGVSAEQPEEQYIEKYNSEWQAYEAMAECIKERCDVESELKTLEKFDKNWYVIMSRKFEEAKSFADFAVEYLTKKHNLTL